MAINCPQCGQAMNEVDATQARCAKHGAYQVLFKRSAEDDGTIPLSESSAPPPVPRQAAPAYAQQPAPAYGQQYVPYAQANPYANLGPCQNHPQVQAVQRCTRCSARVCAVCEFGFPGDIHLCPRCVTSSSGGLSPGRRGMMIGAYIAAGLATLLIGLVIFASVSGNGILAMVLFYILVASIISGLGLGLGIVDRQLNNPVSIWIAAAWNGVLALGLLLLVIVGLMHQSGS